VLVARRRDLLDLVSQFGVPLTQRGRASFEQEFTKRLRGKMTDPLVDALHRRTHYLAWVDRSSSDLRVQVVDVGRDMTHWGLAGAGRDCHCASMLVTTTSSTDSQIAAETSKRTTLRPFGRCELE
jgi:hypothetical protein